MPSITFRIALFALFFICLYYVLFRRRDRHERNTVTGQVLYQKLNAIALRKEEDSKGWFFCYLRQIDPFVFEELILIALEKRGYTIRQNKRYTGDGGVDGRASKDGSKYLIQCKRYSGYVNSKHVEAFSRLCHHKGVKGFFVHTGKTGDGAKVVVADDDAVTIISGSRLYDLIIKPASTE